MAKHFHPFSNATAFMLWQDHNCCRCAKMADAEASLDEIACEIERAIIESACFDNGVKQEIAVRMGYLSGGEESKFCDYDCTERLDTPEIAEEKRRASEPELGLEWRK